MRAEIVGFLRLAVGLPFFLAGGLLGLGQRRHMLETQWNGSGRTWDSSRRQHPRELEESLAADEVDVEVRRERIPPIGNAGLKK
jgi:hypothetical protein